LEAASRPVWFFPQKDLRFVLEVRSFADYGSPSPLFAYVRAA
jgi:hypothetical protein